MDIKKIFDLKVGDRFYYLSDKSRKVWQVDFIELTTKINAFNQEVPLAIYHLKNDINTTKKEIKNIQVKLIRSVNA